MIISLILAGSLAADSIDFVGPLSDLPREVQRYAEARLTIDPVLERRVVCIHAMSEDLSSTLKALSRSIGAELVTKSGGFHLRVDKDEIKRRADTEQLAREQRISRYLETNERQANLTADDVAKGISELKAQSVAHLAPTLAKSLHLKLLASIGPKTLAQIPHYAPQIWSNQSTIAELSLPTSTESHLNEYKAKLKDLKKIVEAWDPSSFGPNNFEGVIRPILNQKDVGRLQLGYANYGTSFFTVLNIFDDRGNRLTFNHEHDEPDWRTIPAYKGTDDPLILEPGLLKLLEETEVPFRATAERVSELLELINSEPHALITQPLLRQIANRENASFAVELTDRAFRDLADKPPKTSKDLCLRLAGSGISLELKNGWLTSRLTLASHGHELSLERDSWRKWIGGAKLTGREWLRAEAVLAAKNGRGFAWSPLDNWVRSRVLMSLRAETVPSELFPLPVLRSLGKLSEAEWNSFILGKEVSVGSGTSIADLLLSFANETLALEAVPGRRPLLDFEKAGTVSLQNGFPVGSKLRLSQISEPAWKAPEFGPVPVRLTSLGSRIGNEISSFGLPEVRARISGKGVFGRLLFDIITISYGPHLLLNLNTYGSDFRPESGLISFDDWPEESRSSFMNSVRQNFEERAPQTTAKPPL